MILAFVSTLSWFAVCRMHSFKAHVHDLALITQTLESTLRGEWFRTSINPTIGLPESYLGNHFSPGLLLFLPFYALFRSPESLLILQALYLGLSAWPAYRIARRRFSRSASLMFAGILLLSPALWSAGMYDFHHETICVPLLLLAWYLVERGRVGLACVTVLLVATMKEHLPLVGMLFGLYVAWVTPQKKSGFAFAASMGLLFVLVIAVFMPAFNNGQSHAYFERRFPHLGAGAGEALITLLTQPGVVLAHMTTTRHRYYYYALLAPFSYLPLLAPTPLLMAASTIFINTQSTLPISYDIGFYHADSILPFLFIAMVQGADRFRRLFRRVTGKLDRLPGGPGLVLVGMALFGHATIESAFLPGIISPLSPKAIREDYRVTPHHARIRTVQIWIDPTKSLCVQANLACFFTRVPDLSPFPMGAAKAQQILIDLTQPYAHRREFNRFWIEYSLQSTIEDYCSQLRLLLEDGRHRVECFEDGFVLLVPGDADEKSQGVRDSLADICSKYANLEGRGYGASRFSHPVDDGSDPE